MKWRILLALVALYFHLTIQNGNKAGIDDRNIGSDIYSTAAASRTNTPLDTSMCSNKSNIGIWPLYCCSYRLLAILITDRPGINCKSTQPEVTTTTTGPNRDTVNEVRKIT